MVPTVEHTEGNWQSSWTAKSICVGEKNGILPLNFAPTIQMAVLPKVRSAVCAASQLPGEGPFDVEDALHLHVNQNPMMMMMLQYQNSK